MKQGRKISGGKYKKRRKKKSYERPGQIVEIKIGEGKRKSRKIMGGRKKTFFLNVKFVNLSSEKAGKVKKLEIKNVLETPSNRFFARRNIVTKGTIVETDLGKVKITNRPSQEGVVNGVLIKE